MVKFDCDGQKRARGNTQDADDFSHGQQERVMDDWAYSGLMCCHTPRPYRKASKMASVGEGKNRGRICDDELQRDHSSARNESQSRSLRPRHFRVRAITCICFISNLELRVKWTAAEIEAGQEKSASRSGAAGCCQKRPKARPRPTPRCTRSETRGAQKTRKGCHPLQLMRGRRRRGMEWLTRRGGNSSRRVQIRDGD